MATNSVNFKRWGKNEFWGLSSDYDPDWILTPNQITLRDKLIELCRIKIRPHAIHCDKTYEYPRKSLDALAGLGLLGLIVPKELNGLGENHVAAAVICETLARYGCPSTAMIYTMHIAATTTLLFRYHDNAKLIELLKKLDKEKLVGTLSYSDPCTGGHFWFPMSSKIRELDANRLQLLKYGSWATSAGFADWYTIQTVSPNFNGDYSNLSCFLIYKNEVRSSSDDWSALGMHGNQSAPLIIEGVFNKDRLVGPVGDGSKSNDECVDTYFLLLSSSCWNGISLACIDLAKKHVTRKAHADAGIRVCDYPTIQDYFGNCVSSTSICRSHVYMMSEGMDKKTNDNDWSLHRDFDFMPRTQFLHWLWICKLQTAKNVSEVTDSMLHACGGSGYKTDLGLERLLRDGKAGWVMGPSNEVLRQFVGKSSLMGLEVIDYWNKHSDERMLHNELGKMSLCDKKNLLKSLIDEITQEETVKNEHSEQDFYNPFNTAPPKQIKEVSVDGEVRTTGLNIENYTKLKLSQKITLSKNFSEFTFDFEDKKCHSGCFAGQYLQIRIITGEATHERYFSPVSKPNDFGHIKLILKFETHGILSTFFRQMKTGDEIEFRGPCGGFEYEPNSIEHLVIVASGAGVTPGLQLIRAIAADSLDKTHITLLYYADNYDDILHKSELDLYDEKNAKVRVIYSLGETPENWNGEEGFMDTNILKKYLPQNNGLKTQVILCGGATMLISCVHSLRTLKVPSETIFIYGAFGAQQIKAVYGPNAKLSMHKCYNAV